MNETATATATVVPDYDPNPIIQAAETLWNDKNDLDGAVLTYQTALLEWGDDYYASATATASKNKNEDLVNGMASLYLSYANFYRKAKQFKSCEEAYEQATQDRVVGGLGRVWLDYARFCEERQRVQKAKKVYLRALSYGAVKDDPDAIEELWQEFHRMMLELPENSNNNNNLSLVDLKAAVQAELQSYAEAESNSSDEVSRKRKADTDVITEQGSGSSGQPDAKKVNVVGAASENNTSTSEIIEAPIKRLTGAQLELSIASVDKKIDSEANSLITSAFPTELSAAWMAKDGGNRPSRITPLLFQSNPPSTETASGKDIVGLEVALQITQLLLGKSSPNTENKDNSVNALDKGAVVLDVVKSCWAMTALFELKSKELMEDLEKKMREEYSLMTEVSEDNQAFTTKCREQFNQRVEFIAWESRKILATHQLLLKHIGIPNIDHAVDENEIKIQRDICAVLHSAFLLRDKVGSKAHAALLLSNEKKLSAELSNATLSQPPIQHSVLMPIIHGQPQPQMPMMQIPYFPPPPQFYPQQQPHMGMAQQGFAPGFQQSMQMQNFPPNIPQQHPQQQQNQYYNMG